MFVKRTAEDMEKVVTPYIGARYHLSWAYRACKWKLKEFIGKDKCLLIASVSGKELTANIKDLRELK